MKKLLLLAFIGLGLCTQTIKADVPDLSDWVRENTKLPEADRDLGRAAAVILWAKQGTDFNSMGKRYKIIFTKDDSFLGNSKETFDTIMNSITPGLHPTIEALREGRIELWRDGSQYTLYEWREDIKHTPYEYELGKRAEFTIATREQVEEAEEREAELLKTEVLSIHNSRKTFKKILTTSDQRWVDKAIKVIIDAYKNHVNSNSDHTKRLDGFIKAYLIRESQTPEIVELINSLER